jgi:hypothetical protein
MGTELICIIPGIVVIALVLLYRWGTMETRRKAKITTERLLALLSNPKKEEIDTFMALGEPVVPALVSFVKQRGIYLSGSELELVCSLLARSGAPEAAPTLLWLIQLLGYSSYTLQALAQVTSPQAVLAIPGILTLAYASDCADFLIPLMETTPDIRSTNALWSTIEECEKIFSRHDAEAALVKIGEPSLEPLRQARIEVSQEAAKSYMDVLERLGATSGVYGARAGQFLVRYLNHEDKVVRREACAKLGRLRVTAAAERLTALLEDPAGDVDLSDSDLSWSMEDYASSALRMIGAPAIPYLQNALASPGYKAKNAASKLLEEIQKKPA